MNAGTGSRAARFGSSLALLAVCVVGIPAMLVVAATARFGGGAPWHGIPAPDEWEWSAIRRSLTDRLTEDTVADIVIRTSLVAAWVAVIVLLGTVVVEVFHMTRHGGMPMPDVRGLGAPQSIARVIAAGLLVVAPMLTSPARASAGDGSTLHLPSSRASPAGQELVETPGGGGAAARHDARASVDAAPHRVPTPEIDDAVGASEYVVRAGDSVFGIAERLAGPDPSAVAAYAEQLVEINLGRRMPDGGRFTNAAYIDVGWVLVLPAPPPTGATTARGVQPPGPDHVVARGETLWSIAEDELGDPARWPEIFETNRGRTFDDGRSLADPSLIQPGWALDLPDANTGASVAADPDVAEHVDAPSADPVDPEVPDEGLVDASGADPVDPEVPDEGLVDAPGADPVDPEAPDEGLVDASGADPVGRVIANPPPAERVDEVTGGVAEDEPDGTMGAPRPSNRWIGAPVDAGIQPAAVRSVLPDGRAPEPDDLGPGDASGSPLQLLTLGRAAMLSAGVLTLLTVRRRSRLRRARPRARLSEPDPTVATTERRLRSCEPGDRFLRADLAVRAAAMPLVAAGRRVVALTVADDGGLDLHASGPARLDPPWIPTEDARRHQLPASVTIELLAASARGVGAPCPALVQLGRTCDGRDLYVDLEALEALEVGGPGHAADAIVTALAATLAGSVLAEVTTLVGVGIDDAAFLGHRGHVPVRDPVSAFARAAEAVGSTATRGRDTFELRARATGGETWEPAVVLLGAAAGTVTPPTDRTGLAVVSASPIHGPSSRLAPEDGAWMLRPLGVRCIPVGFEPGDLTALAALLGTADADLVEDESTVASGVASAVVSGVASPIDRLDPDDDLTLAPIPDEPGLGDPPPRPRPPVIVRLLGPVSVTSADGREAAFVKSKAKELIAWLATHRERATRSAARTALWELDVRDATFANVVSEARRTLARLVPPPDGEEWIARTLTEALPLHDQVRTDADLVREALDAARLQPPDQAIATLRPAIDLVVGMPFESTGYLWPEAEGIASQLVLLATTATAELAAHCLSIGDLDGVFDATARGLQVLPGHEELIGLRMRAHATAGDPAGVRLEWEQYERVVDADPWSDGEPSPTLVDLRRELLAR